MVLDLNFCITLLLGFMLGFLINTFAWPALMRFCYGIDVIHGAMPDDHLRVSQELPPENSMIKQAVEQATRSVSAQLDHLNALTTKNQLAMIGGIQKLLERLKVQEEAPPPPDKTKIELKREASH